jgi:tripartite-type tricarboxylate transporter receptor subunit TctC
VYDPRKDASLNRREFMRLGAAAATATICSHAVQAQSTYPDHAVKLIVPRPAGGVVDVIAREWSNAVSTTFGAAYVENMGGGGGIIAAAFAARAPADGYTLLFGTTSELVLSPLLGHQSYDPVTSFAPISIICESIAAIVVNPTVPATNLGELVAYAKKNPGHLSYGSAGAGTVSNMAGELFKRLSGLSDVTHVPYRGGNPAMTDLIAGNIPIMTPMMDQAIIALHRQGQIRVLAVASERRLPAMPEISTAAEQGYPDLVARLFVGLFAPVATPQPIQAKVEAVTRQAMQDSRLQESFANAGFVSVTNSTPTSAARYLDGEIQRWKPLLQQTGLN